MKKTTYQQHGYTNQKAYFAHLAKENRVKLETVKELAAFYGQDEEFGAMLNALKIYEGELDGIKAIKINYSNEKSLNIHLHHFDNRIYTKIFENLTSKTKFSFSAKIAEYVVLELGLKFCLDEDDLPNVVFRDLFIDVCDRVCADNESIYDYYIDKSSITTLHASEHLDAMIKAAFKKAKLFFGLHSAVDLHQRQQFEYAIKYGIIFMIAKNYFLIED